MAVIRRCVRTVVWVLRSPRRAVPVVLEDLRHELRLMLYPARRAVWVMITPHRTRRADDVRWLLRAAVDRTEPRLAFHGHWHHQNRDRIADRPSDVFGLAGDGRRGYLAALSLEDLDAAYLPVGRRV